MKTLREYIELIENAESASTPTLKVVNQYDARDPNDEDFFGSDVVTEFELLDQNGNVVGQAEYHSYFSDLYIDGKKVNASHPLYFKAQEMALRVNEDAADDSNLQPGTPIMVWLGPPSNNPPRDDKQHWTKGVVVSTPERMGREWRVLVKTDAFGQNIISPSRVFVLKQQGLEEDAADDVAKLAKEMRK